MRRRTMCSTVVPEVELAKHEAAAAAGARPNEFELCPDGALKEILKTKDLYDALRLTVCSGNPSKWFSERHLSWVRLFQKFSLPPSHIRKRPTP